MKSRYVIVLSIVLVGAGLTAVPVSTCAGNTPSLAETARSAGELHDIRGRADADTKRSRGSHGSESDAGSGTVNTAQRVPVSTDWPTYLGDSQRTGQAHGETLLTAASAAHLSLGWSPWTDGSVYTEPIVVNRWVYWGTFGGYEHAATMGRAVWSTRLGKARTTGCGSSSLGIGSTATVTPTTQRGATLSTLFVGGADAQVYALNAQTGRIIWHTPVGTPGQAFLWSSPLVYRGSVYIGISSFGDCPLVRGALVKLNANTGAIEDRLWTAPRGCIGAGVWSSPALDPAAGTIYFTTGNDWPCRTSEVLAEAMVEVRARDLSLLGSWAIPARQRGGDSDFGATPTLFWGRITAKGKVPLVGAVNKNGVYYAFRRGNLRAGPVWSSRIGVGGSEPANGDADIAPSAWNGSMLFVAGGKTTIRGVACKGSLRSLYPSTGKAAWQECLPGPVLGAPVLAPGIVEVGAGGHIVLATTSSGRILYDHAFGGSFQAAGSISGGILYQGNSNWRLYSLSSSKLTGLTNARGGH